MLQRRRGFPVWGLARFCICFHSQNPEMHFVHTAGIRAVAPATPSDAKGLIKSAIRDNNPVLFLEHKFLYRRIKEEVPEGDYTVPIGKARLHREGRDLSIITYAAIGSHCAAGCRHTGPRRH